FVHLVARLDPRRGNAIGLEHRPADVSRRAWMALEVHVLDGSRRAGNRPPPRRRVMDDVNEALGDFDPDEIPEPSLEIVRKRRGQSPPRGGICLDGDAGPIEREDDAPPFLPIPAEV